MCLGNICRSPVAEGVLLHLKEKNRLNLEVDSAGTAGYHIGEAPDPRTIANARKHGIDLSPLRARQFMLSDFKHFDYIFAMDQSNFQQLLKLSPDAESKARVHLFLEFAADKTGQPVPDPYYGSEKDFEEVFNLIENACKMLLKKIS